MASEAAFICESCGSRVNPVVLTKGSILIEIVLWLFLIVPGLVYSLWRMTTKSKGCPNCKSEKLIPLSTPKGQALLKQYSV